jgi:hypothetical protein
VAAPLPLSGGQVTYDGVGSRGEQAFMTVVLVTDAVRRFTVVPEHFDDLCGPVVNSDNPAVHQQLVAYGRLHLRDLL